MYNCLRILFKCAYTEPGIIPCIPTKDMNQGGSYQVEYVREYERNFKSSNVEHFYTEDRFRISHMTGPKIESYALSLCTTCNLLRPPRSFHCRTCGVCIEEQDHHCPWMGTCIGKRNVVYFLSFLWLTALHAFITFCLTCLFFVYVSKGDLLTVDD